MRVYGVQLNVTDMDSAIQFYSNKIGFETTSKTAQTVELKNKGLRLFLNLVPTQVDIKYGKESQTILVLQTNNLDSAISAFKKKGIRFISGKIENGVGYSAPFIDPFGNVISLLEQSKFPEPRFNEP